jgi:hypothetical protein
MLALCRRKGAACLMGALLASPALIAADSVEVYNPAGIRADGVYVDNLLKSVMTAVGKNPYGE